MEWSEKGKEDLLKRLKGRRRDPLLGPACHDRNEQQWRAAGCQRSWTDGRQDDGGVCDWGVVFFCHDAMDMAMEESVLLHWEHERRRKVLVCFVFFLYLSASLPCLPDAQHGSCCFLLHLLLCLFLCSSCSTTPLSLSPANLRLIPFLLASPATACRRSMDENHEIGAPGSSKKRGRPRKADTVLLPGEISAVGLVPPTSDVKSRKPRLASCDTSQSGDASNTLVGEPVHGVVDGSFDAGYLVTVRVGDSDTVFRGVVFGPGLSIPLTNTVDVAPKVKTSRRDAVSFPTPLSPMASPSPVAALPNSASVSGGLAMVTVPPAIVDTVVEPSVDTKQQQDSVNQSAQEYASQGFSTAVDGFNLAGPEFNSRSSDFGVEGQTPMARSSEK